MHYLSGSLSLSHFNRRLHALAHWFSWLLDLLCDLFTFRATALTIDSLPVPVWQRVRARRCRKVQGSEYYGYCAAKEQRFFGWRLHLICSERGVPVSYELLPASYHDLTPLLDLAQGLPTDTARYGDKGYNCGEDEAWLEGECGVHLIPVRKQNREANTYSEWLQLRRQRAVIESVNSQLAAWGIQQLHARTHEGFMIKLLASLFALVIVNAL